jgi:phasin family protein
MNTKEGLGAAKEIGSKGMENMKTLAELNMKVLEKIASRQMEAMNYMMEQSKRQMELASEAKGFSELMKGQVELAKETSERMLEETKANMQIANEVRDDYRSFVQKGMSELSEEVKKVTPDALKG